MSYKNLNDLQYLYEGVVSDSQTDELSEAVLYTVVTEMVYRGYSESAINQYLGNISEVELIERFLSTFEIENLTLSEQQEEKRALILEKPNLGGLLKLLGGGKKVTSDTLTREASKRGPGFLKKFQSWLKGSKVTSGAADDAASGASKANKDGRSLLDKVLNRNKPDTKKTELQNRINTAVDKNKDKIGKTNIDTSGSNTAAKVTAASVVGGTTGAVVSNSGNNNQKKNNKVTTAPVTDKDKEDAKKEADLEAVMKASGKYKEVPAPGKGNEGKTVLQKVKDPDPKDNKLDPTPEVKVDKVEKQPEVKTDDYLGKSQGLLGKDDWLKKTRNSPAATSGAFTDDQRWSTQLKHRQWQKDNNRGKFHVKPEKTKSDTYTTKMGAFLNNKKVGDKKGTGNHKITQWQNLESYDAYDLVLNYIMESKQASSIEEANYIMIEMDQNTIHEIVEAQKKTLSEWKGKVAAGAVLTIPWALSELEKRWNPVKKARDKYQDKKATEYENKSGTTKKDGYFR